MAACRATRPHAALSPKCLRDEGRIGTLSFRRLAPEMGTRSNFGNPAEEIDAESCGTRTPVLATDDRLRFLADETVSALSQRNSVSDTKRLVYAADVQSLLSAARRAPVSSYCSGWQGRSTCIIAYFFAVGGTRPLRRRCMAAVA